MFGTWYSYPGTSLRVCDGGRRGSSEAFSEKTFSPAIPTRIVNAVIFEVHRDHCAPVVTNRIEINAPKDTGVAESDNPHPST